MFHNLGHATSSCAQSKNGIMFMTYLTHSKLVFLTMVEAQLLVAPPRNRLTKKAKKKQKDNLRKEAILIVIMSWLCWLINEYSINLNGVLSLLLILLSH